MPRSSVIMELSGDEAKLLQAYQSAMRQNQKFKQELSDLAKTGRQSQNWFSGFQNHVKEAFSPAGIMSFAGALAGAAGGLSVASALQRVVGLAAEARAEIRGFADGLTESYDSAKALWTLSASREAYADLTREQRLAMAQEGINRNEAGSLLFNLKSLGKEDALDEIAKAARFMDPETAAKYYTTVTSPSAYGDAAGTPQQVLSGLLAGARDSKYDPTATGDWFLRVAPSMASIGAGQAETLAVGAALADATANEETLATYMMTLHKTLAKWKAEAVQEAKETTPAPEAPEKPTYEPPKRATRVYSSPQAAQNAELAYQDRLANYEERYAEDMAEYRTKEEEYRQARAEWEHANQEKRRIANAAQNAHGLIDTFEAMRTQDPEAFTAAQLANVRFGAASTAFEQGGVKKAKALMPGIEADIKSARLYEQKTSERPRQLTEQQRLRIANETLALAAEPKAEAENQLRTMIAYNKALANLTDQSDALTKGWEKLVDEGATVAGTREASLQAANALLDAMARRRPDVYQQHFQEFAPVEYKQTTDGRMVPYDVNIHLNKLTPEIVAAVQEAMADLSREKIDARRASELDEAAAYRQPPALPPASLRPLDKPTSPAAIESAPAPPTIPATTRQSDQADIRAADAPPRPYIPPGTSPGELPTIHVNAAPAADNQAVVWGLRDLLAAIRELPDRMNFQSPSPPARPLMTPLVPRELA